jgi:acid phosphatase (class A)
MKIAFLCLFALSLAQVSFADPGTLTTAEIQKLLGRYPSKGSVEEKADFDKMLELQKSRTVADCELAASEVKPNIRTLFTQHNGPISADEMEQAFPKIEKVYQAVQAASRYAKGLYRRPRPFVNNTAIKPCIALESSYAYPSGHTAISRAVARALSVLFPERAELLIKRADEVAFHRVLGGVHHPSDIVAGKKLGDEVAKRVEVLD